MPDDDENRWRSRAGAPPVENEKGSATGREALCHFGGPKRDRTADLHNAIVALSQLSYGPEARQGSPAWEWAVPKSGQKLSSGPF